MTSLQVDPASGRHLLLAEREDVAFWWTQRVSVREIDHRLGRALSTVSLERRRSAATRSSDTGRWASVAQ